MAGLQIPSMAYKPFSSVSHFNKIMCLSHSYVHTHVRSDLFLYFYSDSVPKVYFQR